MSSRRACFLDAEQICQPDSTHCGIGSFELTDCAREFREPARRIADGAGCSSSSQSFRSLALTAAPRGVSVTTN